MKLFATMKFNGPRSCDMSGFKSAPVISKFVCRGQVKNVVMILGPEDVDFCGVSAWQDVRL